MGKKWKVKRGFVKLHMMVDTQTMKIGALSVTDESVADVTEFYSLLDQSMDVIGAKGGAGGASGHSKDPGPGTLAGATAHRPTIPHTKIASCRAPRPSHRPRRTIRG